MTIEIDPTAPVEAQAAAVMQAIAGQLAQEAAGFAARRDAGAHQACRLAAAEIAKAAEALAKEARR